jgi:putative isomerase
VGRRDLDPSRAWNTWDPRYPAQFVHVPTGFCVRVSAFSTRDGRFTDFRYDPATCRLGPHALDGSYAEVELTHAGSLIRIRFAAGDGVAAGEVVVLDTGEWGLRFWFLLEAGFDPGFGYGALRLIVPDGDATYVDPPVTVGTTPSGESAAFVTDIRPVAAHLYDDRADAGLELETRGYYFRPAVADTGRWAVLRLNAVTPSVLFAAAVKPDAADAEATARAAVASAAEATKLVEMGMGVKTAPGTAPVRDIVAWNTVWDTVNDRPYTVATRAWAAEKFGGWFVWQSDAFFHAILAAAAGDHEVARWNVEAALSCTTEYGNLAGLRSGLTDWVDRAHPPLGGHAVWEVHRRHPDKELLETAYPILRRAFDWWFEARDGNGNGLLEYGSSPVGSGHFVHTKLAAMDESSNDNSPVHDEATFDVTTHTLDTEDVGLNSLLVWEAEHLARIARELGGGLEADVGALDERRERLAALVREHLWDDERGLFANRLWSGPFARSASPTSFFPMTAGLATPAQAERMVREHLLEARRFGGDWPVAGTPHDDPAAADNVYWRGRVWPPFNYLVFLGLRRYGYEDEARMLAARSAAMFEMGWRERRSWENCNQGTGEGGDSPDADPFYTWGALLPLLGRLASDDANQVTGSG